MLYRKNNKLVFCAKKVRYVQDGTEYEKYVGSEGEQWWVDFAAKWDNTEIIEFVDVAPDQNQINRLIKVKDYPERCLEDCKTYVKEGIYPEGTSHALRNIQLQEENEQLGVALSQVEIELLELKLGGV